MATKSVEVKFEETLAIRLRAAYLHLHRSANRHFRLFDATADQYALLTCLAEGPGLTQQDLVRKLASDKRTINKMVDLLEEKGHIERRPHDQDGRAWALYLTPVGERHQQLLWDSAGYLRDHLERAVHPVDMETVLEGLEEMAKALDPERLAGEIAAKDPRPNPKKR